MKKNKKLRELESVEKIKIKKMETIEKSRKIEKEGKQKRGAKKERAGKIGKLGKLGKIKKVASIKQRFISYQMQLAINMMVFFMIPFLSFGVIYIRNMKQTRKDSFLIPYRQQTEYFAANISNQIELMEYKMLQFKTNIELRRQLSELEQSSLPEALDYIWVLKGITKSLNADQQNLRIQIYPSDSILCYGGYSYTRNYFISEFENGQNDKKYIEIKNLEEGELCWQVRILNDKTFQKMFFLCLYTRIDYGENRDCIFELGMPVANCFGAYIHTPQDDLKLTSEMKYYIVENNGKEKNILAEYREALTERNRNSIIKLDTGIKQEILKTKVPRMPNIEVICTIPQDLINESIMNDRFVLYSVIAVVGLMIFLASYFAASLFTNYIKKKIFTINKNLSQYLENDIPHEKDGFDGVTERVEELIHKTKEYCANVEVYKNENYRLELELLQMRFNPHFLYNTLATIRALAKNSKIRDVTDSLVHYYRIILNKGKLLIRIREEADMIEEYLTIEKFAYSLEKVDWEIRIEPEVENMTIIKHILQPIVENALFHGIREHKDEGKILITGRFEKDTVLLTVSDDGMGMAEEQIKTLMEDSENTLKQSYGIHNVQQRIQLYYGKEYGLSIKSIRNSGTTVAIRIPALSFDKQKNISEM